MMKKSFQMRVSYLAIEFSKFLNIYSRFLMHFKDNVSHDYLLKIVPTIYEPIEDETLYPFQYTYAYRVSFLLFLFKNGK